MIASATRSEGYRIGTAASLTGLDPHTIRAWERRHGAVEPQRSASGTRLYDDDAIARLQLLKALVDCGEAIGTIAGLSDEALRARLERMAGLAERPAAAADRPLPTRLRLALLAPALEARLRLAGANHPGIEVGVAAEDLDALLEATARRAADVVVLELERLGPEAVGSVQRCVTESGVPVVVLFTFARRSDLARLARTGAQLVRWPLPVEQLRRTILDRRAIDEARRQRPEAPAPVPALPAAPVGDVPDRRFSDEDLARLAEITGALDCECPNHLSAIVSSLLAFEAYSRDCESRNEADAALHARLADGTGRARALTERLLVELCHHENIPI